jgi:hypothetical protein
LIVFAVCVAGGVCAADPVVESYSGGAGTEADPYQIATKQDLLDLGTTTADYDKYFILTADIDLVGETFTTAVIAPDTDNASDDFKGAEFTGSFDGNGHVIRNLTIDTDGAENDCLGLFGKLGSGANVTSLGVKDFVISWNSISKFVGGLCGYNFSGTVTQCYATGSASGGSYVGGLCGKNDSGTISKCYATASASGGRYWDYYVGGLCGQNLGALSTCYATGSVYGHGYAGGLCGGNAEKATILDCYATGKVEGTYHCGGFCGTNSGSISGCFWDTETSRSGISDGGTGKTTKMMQTQSTFAAEGWNFIDETVNGSTGVWTMIGYPELLWAATTTAYSGGSGLESDPCQIATKADLLNLAFTIADYDKHFILTADIDLAGETFATAVIAPDTDNASDGFQGANFTGSFDGNGHVIRNLTINGGESGNEYLGLFGDLGSGARVSGLGVEAFSITGGDNVGGLCGKSTGIISKCHTTGTVTGGDNVGGLCGINASGTVSECCATGSAIGMYKVGGLCGFNDLGNISECYTNGSVNGTTYVGGLCGKSFRGAISDCYAMVSVTGTSYAGGLCGYNDHGTISYCYSRGTVGGGDWMFGGFCGDNYSGTISACFWDRDTSGLGNSYGGIGKTTTEMQSQSIFTDAGWDFVVETINGSDDVWRMDGYPSLDCFSSGGDALVPDSLAGMTITIVEDGDAEETIFAESTFQVIDMLHGDETGSYVYKKISDTTATVTLNMEGGEEYDVMELTFTSETVGTGNVSMYTVGSSAPYHTESVSFTLTENGNVSSVEYSGTYHMEIVREYDAAEDCTAYEMCAIFWPAEGKVFAGGSLTVDGTALAAGECEDGGDELEFCLEYESLAVLRADVVGTLAFTLTYADDTSEELTITVADFAESDFPDYAKPLNIGQGDTGVALAAEFQMGSAAWDWVSIENDATDEDAFFEVSGESVVTVDPPLEPNTLYWVDFDANDYVGDAGYALGSVYGFEFTTAGDGPVISQGETMSLVMDEDGSPMGLTLVSTRSISRGAADPSRVEAEKTTTGAEPPAGTFRGFELPTTRADSGTVIAGVPAYTWHHGCAPTVFGMILGYWDGKGFADLIPGTAAAQTDAVNEFIVSDGHYTDYIVPKDEDEEYPVADCSETAPESCHADDCVADFLHTSRSADGLRYGGSSTAWYESGFAAMVAWAGQGEYEGSATCVLTDDGLETAWTVYQAEIDAGRPVLLSVDTDGSGTTNHAVCGVGYDVVDGERYYICHDTWDVQQHTYLFRGVAVGIEWGVRRVYRFGIAETATDQWIELDATAADESALTWTVSTAPANGEVVLQENTARAAEPMGARIRFTYRPDLNWHGSDEFTIQVADEYGGCDSIQIQVTVNSRNDPPENTRPPMLECASDGAGALTVDVGEWNDDADGGTDAMTYTRQWKANGEAIAGATGQTLDASQYTAGDTVTCEVTAWDGTDEGDAIETDPVAVLALQEGWNLISLPVEPLERDSAKLLVDAVTEHPVFVGAVWGWDGSRYQETTELEAGQGCWVFCLEAPSEALLIPGVPIDDTVFDLHQGWSLLGPVGRMKYCEVSGFAEDAIQGWSGGPDYMTPANNCLSKGLGYWISSEMENQPIDLETNGNSE